jgi:hypothetical protein
LTISAGDASVEPIANWENLELGMLEEFCRPEDECVVVAEPQPIFAACDKAGGIEADSQVTTRSRGDVRPSVAGAVSSAPKRARDDGLARSPVAPNPYGPELFEIIASQWHQMDEADVPRSFEEDAMLPIPVMTAPPCNFGLPAPGPIAAANSGAPASAEVAMRPQHPAPTGIPWPVFAPSEPVATPAIEVVHEVTFPWPVFAPLEPNTRKEAAIASGLTGTAGPIPLAAFDQSGPAPPPATIGASEQGVAVSVGPRTDCRPSPANEPGVAAARQRTDLESSGARDQSLPEPRWGQAVQLTRAAVYAWMKVLAGPAVVEVTSR